MPETSPNPTLARRRRLVAFAAASAALALVAAFVSLFRVGLLPPKLETRQLQGGAAVLHTTLRLPKANRPVTPTAFESQAKRVNLIGNLMASPLILDRVAKRMGLGSDRIAATAEVNESTPVAFAEPNNERDANRILTSHYPYRLDFQSRPAAPMLDIYTQAPSPERAVELAEASVTATNAYLHHLARDGGAAVGLTQLGPARGGALDPKAPLEIAALTALVTFTISFGLLFLLAQIRRGWLRADRQQASGELEPQPRIEVRERRDDWPHTTRILPWMIAGFIGMLWLVPINAIAIEASLPIDLKLDRLALPIIALTWLFARLAGGQSAPHWRFTTVHAAVAGFVAVAFLSVVLNAAYLNQALELELAIKKLTLLGAFFFLFLIVASSVRPSEIRPFMTLTLALAVVCSVGVLWEYQFGSNLFYGWSAKLLPGIFHVAAVNTTGYDEIGRRAVMGPADLSLEVVAMLSMALPIAFVRVMHSDQSRERILYGLAICILVGAMISTYRKSALLAPLSVCAILAYFRRRELLRLAPLGVVILLAIPALAPNALGSILGQFKPGRLGAATVSDRVSDYDAVRPDLLSQLAFGRGFGSYEHTSHRILDNELLARVVETGVVGLIAFVMMIVLVIAIAAPIIRRRDPVLAPAALAIAAAAGAFLVLAVLFDVMSFPHTPYILMTLVGFLAVMVGAAKEERPSAPALGPGAETQQRVPRTTDEASSSAPVPV